MTKSSGNITVFNVIHVLPSLNIVIITIVVVTFSCFNNFFYIKLLDVTCLTKSILIIILLLVDFSKI